MAGAMPKFPRAIKILGLGGVGSIVARYLTLFFASFGLALRVVFIDGDAFEDGNADRMFIPSMGNKACAIRDELRQLLGTNSLVLEAIESYISADNIAQYVQPGDLVILAVDNHATRKLVSDHCAKLSDVTLISGGNDGVDVDEHGKGQKGTYGNVQVFVREDKQDKSPPLTSFHPEIANPTDEIPGPSCGVIAKSMPQILFTNLQTATSILNAMRLHLASELSYSEVHFDVHHGRMQPSSAPGPAYDN